jgi:hypothetical protein
MVAGAIVGQLGKREQFTGRSSPRVRIPRNVTLVTTNVQEAAIQITKLTIFGIRAFGVWYPRNPQVYFPYLYDSIHQNLWFCLSNYLYLLSTYLQWMIFI